MNFLTDIESSLMNLLEGRSAESLLEEESIQELVRDMERMTSERMELLDQKKQLTGGDFIFLQQCGCSARDS